MSWVTLKRQHPLDKLWSVAIDAVSNADTVMDRLGSEFTDEQLNAAGTLRTEAIMTVMALPARNIADSLYKLDLAGVDGDASPRTDCDLRSLMNEATAVLDAEISRGAKLQRYMPDLLEEVAI
ncbi:MAG: hypothetical protein C0494_15845 [Sphingobium sp.]|nr:hypothetical protein [Sphingobium sp.]